MGELELDEEDASASDDDDESDSASITDDDDSDEVSDVEPSDAGDLNSVLTSKQSEADEQFSVWVNDEDNEEDPDKAVDLSSSSV